MSEQIEILANFIMAKIPGEPSQNEGAGDTAIRLLSVYRAAMSDALNEIGVPGPGYPANVAMAHKVLHSALWHAVHPKYAHQEAEAEESKKAAQKLLDDVEWAERWLSLEPWSSMQRRRLKEARSAYLVLVSEAEAFRWPARAAAARAAVEAAAVETKEAKP